MSRRTRLASVLTAVLALAPISPAFAADPRTSAASEPSPAAREQMAAIHQRMAECLRSDRSFEECRTEMRASCHTAMGASGCPMMEGGGMHRGMMGQGGMRGMGGPSGQGAPAPENPKP